MSHACHPFWKCCRTFAFCSLLRRCTIPCACHAKRHLNVQKCSVPVSNLHFEMCFAPQQRALFRHLNFQMWSEHGVFCTFSLRNVLRATTACTFSTSQLPKVVRTPGVFCTFCLRNVLRATTACNFSSLIWPDGSAPAALASLLFDPPEPQIIGKTQCFATFLPFRASASSFFWLFLFSDLLSSTLLFSLTLPISAFHPSILSEVWLLNFLRWCSLMLAESVIVDLANWCCHSLSLLVWAITSRTRVNRLICYFAMCRQAKGTPRFLDEVEVQCSLKEFEEHATFVPVLTWFF